MNEVTSIMLRRIEEIDQRDEQQILAELAGIAAVLRICRPAHQKPRG